MIETKEEFPFLWDDIHKYFPRKEIARLRKKLMEEYRSGVYTDKELMERYHMSKQTLYDTIQVVPIIVPSSHALNRFSKLCRPNQPDIR